MKPFPVFAIALTLSACSGGGVKDTLGLNRAAPDEFRVVSRPPLSVPPQFVLRPPSPTAASPNQLPASDYAQSLVMGGGKPSPEAAASLNPSAGGSRAEAQFLSNAGASAADPSVRAALAEEKFSAQEVAESDSWWDVFASEPPRKDPIVHPKKEAERIQKNEDEGKPVTEGETPEVKARDTGVLGRLLGY